MLITGTHPRCGKTLLGCALAFAARSRGIRTGVMKPVDRKASVNNGIIESSDARGLAYGAGCDLPMELLCPCANAATDLHLIRDAYLKIASRSDFTIVEGGSLAETLASSKDYADLARMLDLKIVLVAGNRPRWINDARLATTYALSRGLSIAGVVLNDVEPASAPVDESDLAIPGAAFLGHILHKQPVARVIIDALLPPHAASR